MNKYEEALDWLTWRCMEPNEDYEGLVYDQVPDFEIEANIEPLRELIEKATPKKPLEAPEHWNKYYWVCPTCEKLNPRVFNLNYCGYCGQKIDWSEDEKHLKEGEQEEN